MMGYGLVLLSLGTLIRRNQAFLQSPTRTQSTATASTLLSGQKSKGSFNPISSMIGDMASSLFGGSSSSSANVPFDPSSIDPAFRSALQEYSSSATSWETIRETLMAASTTPEERSFRDDAIRGRVGSPLNLVRIFHDDNDNVNDNIRVIFYRDHASWCPYCQKVWLTLEEKKIPYRVEKINMSCYGDKPRSFFQIQPGGQIPVAKIDGKIYGQSNDIIDALEELFPDHKSLRPETKELQRAQQLLRLERTLFSAWMYWLRGGLSESQRNRATFEQVLGDVEAALGGGPFFMGETVTMVDFQFAPFLERMAASLLYFKGFQMRVSKGAPTKYPNVNKWFDAMEELESYQLTKSDYYTHCWDLPPQLGGCTREPDGEPYARAIDGERLLDGSRGSWELPLVADNGGVEPDWSWCGGGDDDEAGAAAAKREAVERISANHQAIVKFAARGAGRKGMPPVMAPLADPNAISNEAVQEGVNLCLMQICLALLNDTDQHGNSMKDVAKLMASQPGYARGVVDSLAYLRDRVGVPRDMRLPAARQLRAHLNFAIGTILESQTGESTPSPRSNA